MSGEELHALGRAGALRAKAWLEASTRATVPWVNPETREKLAFSWADGSEFSFDIGGTLRGEDLEGKEFFSETKLYRSSSDQGTHYREFLAKCYRAWMELPNRCDVFIWITWAPFLVATWPALRAPQTVSNEVKLRAEKVFGAEVVGSDRDDHLEENAAQIAERLWLFVLSDEQENLVLTPDHRAVVEAHIVRQGAGM
jgi:hypothetical protein